MRIKPGSQVRRGCIYAHLTIADALASWGPLISIFHSNGKGAKGWKRVIIYLVLARSSGRSRARARARRASRINTNCVSHGDPAWHVLILHYESLDSSSFAKRFYKLESSILSININLIISFFLFLITNFRWNFAINRGVVPCSGEKLRRFRNFENEIS